MANKQTRALRKRGLSLKFNKGVDFSKERKMPDLNPEFTLVGRDTARGYSVDSSVERAATRRKPYRAPTRKVTEQMATKMRNDIRAYYDLPPVRPFGKVA